QPFPGRGTWNLSSSLYVLPQPCNAKNAFFVLQGFRFALTFLRQFRLHLSPAKQKMHFLLCGAFGLH
uniref:hypothetical protein n=1 Tax=Prevotellamassilia timonensis TaxID=1852370 RepID=UPI004038C7EE